MSIRGTIGDTLSCIRSMSDKPRDASPEYSCPFCRAFFRSNTELKDHLETYLSPPDGLKTRTFEGMRRNPLNIRAYTDGTADMHYQQQAEGILRLKRVLSSFLVIIPEQITEYGSFICRTQVGESDIDLSIDFPFESIMTHDEQIRFSRAMPDTKARDRIFDEFVLRLLKKYLENKRYRTIFCPGRVRVLKVLLILGGFDVCVDLTLNNTLAIRNSQLIAEYIRIYPPFQLLVLIVKHWVKVKGIGGATNEFLSSYAYTIWMIYFLIRYDYVPNLQEASHSSEIIDDFECKFLKNSNAVQKRIPFTKLLHGFYEFVCGTNWNHVVVCIKTSRVKSFAMKASERVKWRRDQLWIEDPFDTRRNLGDVMYKKENRRLLEREFKEAFQVLESKSERRIDEYFDLNLEALIGAFAR
mmetsp:Transcript_5861/g.10439  ORF Transcript_5861/g.10439 Transcript_5861/m.10439 type:complete len:412 (+) Transcript_5861:2-1237(+)